MPSRRPTPPFGLYAHVPFCARKCPYCDFNTFSGLEAWHDRFVAALVDEIGRWAEPLADRLVGTIFVGGGTPTVLSIAHLERILAAIHEAFRLTDDCEITCEANPGVDRERFAGLRALGINRLSLGAQSLQPDELRLLGRLHDVDDVHRAFETARGAGFENISLDFMFGLPGQATAAWEATLAGALALAPEHLSLYGLIVEPGTPLHDWVQAGRVATPNEDAAAEHYEAAMDRLTSAGYVQYEVSNWARATGPGDVPALACQHNLTYWRNGEYLGVGPGAHGHLRLADPAGAPVDRRWGNVRPVPDYVRRARGGLALEDFAETLSARQAMGETMMLGLRLTAEGVPYRRFRALHGVDPRAVFAAELDELSGWGLLEADDERVRLSRRGLMVGNQVCARFLADPPPDEPARRPS